MRLDTYLKEKQLTPEAFGVLVGASGSAVKKWLRGERRPRSEMLAKIAEATGAAVQPNDFFEPRASAA